MHEMGAAGTTPRSRISPRARFTFCEHFCMDKRKLPTSNPRTNDPRCQTGEPSPFPSRLQYQPQGRTLDAVSEQPTRTSQRLRIDDRRNRAYKWSEFGAPHPLCGLIWQHASVPCRTLQMKRYRIRSVAEAYRTGGETTPTVSCTIIPESLCGSHQQTKLRFSSDRGEQKCQPRFIFRFAPSR